VLAHPWLRRILLANLVMQVLIVVTGGLVRLTGSGLGCPTWPQCEPGSYTPSFEPADGIHPYIEFGNRMLGILVGAVALLTVLAVWRWARRRPMTLLAGLVLGGTLAQGVLGGVTVRTGLHPLTVMAHFLISMLLVVASTLLLWHLQARPSGPAAPPLLRQLYWATVGLGAVVLVLGTVVTGAGPHSGDADEPARLALDPELMSRVHAASVWVFLGLLVGVFLVLRRMPQDTRALTAPWTVVLAVTLLQGVIGYVQYFTGLPVALVSLHMLGAALLTVCLTWAHRCTLGTSTRSATTAAGRGLTAEPAQPSGSGR
jgi:cytochrome c oxidase assembly protein subunit 15